MMYIFMQLLLVTSTLFIITIYREIFTLLYFHKFWKFCSVAKLNFAKVSPCHTFYVAHMVHSQKYFLQNYYWNHHFRENFPVYSIQHFLISLPSKPLPLPLLPHLLPHVLSFRRWREWRSSWMWSPFVFLLSLWSLTPLLLSGLGLYVEYSLSLTLPLW